MCIVLITYITITVNIEWKHWYLLPIFIGLLSFFSGILLVGMKVRKNVKLRNRRHTSQSEQIEVNQVGGTPNSGVMISRGAIKNDHILYSIELRRRSLTNEDFVTHTYEIYERLNRKVVMVENKLRRIEVKEIEAEGIQSLGATQYAEYISLKTNRKALEHTLKSYILKKDNYYNTFNQQIIQSRLND